MSDPSERVSNHGDVPRCPPGPSIMKEGGPSRKRAVSHLGPWPGLRFSCCLLPLVVGSTAFSVRSFFLLFLCFLFFFWSALLLPLITAGGGGRIKIRLISSSSSSSPPSVPSVEPPAAARSLFHFIHGGERKRRK